MHNVYPLHVFFYSLTYFGVVCTFIRKKYNALYLKPHIAKILLNVVSVVSIAFAS